MGPGKKTIPFQKAIAIIGLFFIIFIAAYDNFSRSKVRQDIEEHARVLGEALWHVNKTILAEYLKEVTNRDNYIQLTVYDEAGAVFYEGKSTAPNALIRLFEVLKLTRIQLDTSDIVFNDNKIGRVAVQWRSTAIFVFLYCLVMMALIVISLKLYNKLVHANLFLEDRVEQRTRELMQSDSKFHLVAHHSKLLIYDYHVESRNIVWSGAIEKVTGYTEEEFRDFGINQWIEHLHPQDADEALTLLEEAQNAVGNYKVIYRYRHKNGSYIFIEDEGRFLAGKEGLATQMIGSMRDITASQQMQLALKRERDYNKRLFQSTPVFIVVVGNNGKIAVMNDFMLRSLGYSSKEVIGEDFLSKLIAEQYQKQIVETHERLRQSDLTITDKIHLRKKNGQELYVEWHSARTTDLQGNTEGVVWVGLDITARTEAEHEKAELEKELRQSQKMESIGTLAGGIAHDFNNILTGIFGYTELALLNIDEREQLLANINEVLAGAERAKNLVSQILAFCRKTDYAKKPIKVATCVKDALKLLRRTIPTTIDIQENIVSQEIVNANPIQIHQIVMNLCTNAYHAMRDTGGTLSVNVIDIDLPDNGISTSINLRPGKYLCLEIQDTGVGMDRQTREKIFEPYFTTKGIGEGTGLGLAVVHGLLQSLDGTVTIDSEPGQGATFQVYIPTIEQSISEEVNAQKHLLTGGSENILLVDDDDSIIHSTTQFLTHNGYTVRAFCNGSEALQGFHLDSNSFDLVITDMTMPGMTGVQLAQKILAKRPKLPIILCTGHSDLITRSKALEMGITEYCEKPLKMSELLPIIRTILDEAALGA